MAHYVRTLLVTGPPDEVAPAAEKHRAHLRQLKEAGKLRLAGEFANGEGFLEIFDVADRMEAEQLARSSPLVEDGLATWMLREWQEL
jgi:uncharacterized protein YciI